MRTRICEWLDIRTSVSGTRSRVKTRVLYGVQVFHDGKWAHAHKDGKALLYPNKDLAEEKRAILRKRPSPAPKENR